MPAILPGVVVTPVDQSDVIILNTSAVFGMVGTFEKGPDDSPELVTNKDTLTKVFGTIDNAVDKKSYISAIELLKTAEGIYIANVTKNALFGGINISDAGQSAFTSGVTTRSSFDFSTDTIEEDVVAEVLDIGDGSTLVFSGTSDEDNIVEASFVVSYTIGGVVYSGTDNGLGVLTGTNMTGTISYVTGDWTLTFTIAPDNAINVTVSYTHNADFLFVLIARSKKSWADNLAVKISDVNSTDNTFIIHEYLKATDGTVTEIGVGMLVSRNTTAVDGFGKPIYIETVLTNESYLLYAINNTDIVYTSLPIDSTTYIYTDGGDDGSTVTTVEQSIAVNLFDTSEFTWNFFIGAGIIEKTVLDDMIALSVKYHRVTYIDTLAGLESAVKTWVDSTLNIDAKECSAFTPNAYTSYNGNEWYTPASAIAGQKKANKVATGQPYMPPAGVGVNNGGINVVKLERYYNDTEILDLHKSGVNVLRRIDGVGNLIFSDFTMQSKLSATSYMNSVETLNVMIVEFNKALLVLNFKVINDTLYLQLETLINGFLSQLANYDGTIEQGWEIDFGKNTTITKDAGTVYVDLIFVFQSLARKINLNLIYTSNTLFAEIA